MDRCNVQKGVRYRVLSRDNFTCRYCGDSAPDVRLVVDHILPMSRGGSNLESNLITSCQDCNAGKNCKESIPIIPIDRIDAHELQDVIRSLDKIVKATGKVTEYLKTLMKHEDIAEHLNQTKEPDAFDVFWKAYPGKKGGGREQLRKKWKKAKLDAKAEHVMAVLKALKQSEQWTKDNGQFIPMLSTFLNQQRWDCDIEDIQSQPGGVDVYAMMGWDKEQENE